MKCEADDEKKTCRRRCCCCRSLGYAQLDILFISLCPGSIKEDNQLLQLHYASINVHFETES